MVKQNRIIIIFLMRVTFVTIVTLQMLVTQMSEAVSPLRTQYLRFDHP